VSPPPGTIAWIEQHVGRRVAGTAPIDSARTCDLYEVLVEGADQRFALRCYTRPAYLEEHPEPVEREQRAIELVATVGVPTPELIAADPSGEACGVPASLVTLVAGSTSAVPAHWLAVSEEMIERWCGLPPVRVPWTFRRYQWDVSLSPPAWSRWPRRWERVIELVEAWTPPCDAVIHRDFHQANTLWRDGGLPAVIDWDRLCRGPRGMDAAHFRLNLFVDHGPEVAAAFAPHRRDPMCELADACDWLPLEGDSRGQRLDAFISSTLAEL
jgi:aminoglycoside phosphotransferase (APT) family kinase protein